MQRLRPSTHRRPAGGGTAYCCLTRRWRCCTPQLFWNSLASLSPGPCCSFELSLASCKLQHELPREHAAPQLAVHIGSACKFRCSSQGAEGRPPATSKLLIGQRVLPAAEATARGEQAAEPAGVAAGAVRTGTATELSTARCRRRRRRCLHPPCCAVTASHCSLDLQARALSASAASLDTLDQEPTGELAFTAHPLLPSSDTSPTHPTRRPARMHPNQSPPAPPMLAVQAPRPQQLHPQPCCQRRL